MQKFFSTHMKAEHGRLPTQQRFGGSMRSQAEQLVRLSRLVDALIVAVAFAFVWNPDLHRSEAELVAVLLLAPFWMSLFGFYGLYESHRLGGFSALTRRLLSAQATGSFFLMPIMFFVADSKILLQIVSFLAIGTTAMLCQKWLLYTLLYFVRQRGFDQRRVCVVGSWETARSIEEEFTHHPEWGIHVSCVGIGDPLNRKFVLYPSGEALTKSLEDVPRKQVIDEFLIAVPTEKVQQEKAVMALCEEYGLVGRVLPFPFDLKLEAADLEEFCGKISISVGGLHHDGLAVAIKRLLDVVVATLLLVFLSPVLLLTALLVKLSSRGPIVFAQNRVRLRGRHFKMYKFRTMIDGADSMLQSVAHKSISEGPIFKARVDWRITPIGRVLRRCSIDELPQLVNVVKGGMSLVGPRPLPTAQAEAISGLHRKRFSMRPGITCLWQVNGRSDLEYADWVNYDLQYVDKWSLWLDAKLLLWTIPAVLSGRGAY